jgi:hypothetical protein
MIVVMTDDDLAVARIRNIGRYFAMPIPPCPVCGSPSVQVEAWDTLSIWACHQAVSEQTRPQSQQTRLLNEAHITRSERVIPVGGEDLLKCIEEVDQWRKDHPRGMYRSSETPRSPTRS